MSNDENILCGIYKIINIVNGKIYIGKSKNIKKRWKREKKGKELNQHIVRSFKRYGINFFQWVLIEECLLEQLKEREEYWMNYFESWNEKKGYNIRKISDGVEHHSEKSKKKMSIVRKGKKLSEEHKKKISDNTKIGMSNPEVKKNYESLN